MPAVGTRKLKRERNQHVGEERGGLAADETKYPCNLECGKKWEKMGTIFIVVAYPSV